MRPVTAIANHLIQRASESGKTLTGGQLHHLVYFAHGLRLSMVHEPLLDEPVLADASGVSIQGLKAHSIMGNRPVNGLLLLLVKRADGRIDDDTPTLVADDPAIYTLDMVWSRFGSFAETHMAMFVRSSGGPWANAWYAPDRGDRETVTLANSDIRNWFRGLLIQENKDRANADGLEPTVLMSRYNLANTLVPRN
jgi:uncharacterized phage-associated protein